MKKQLTYIIFLIGLFFVCTTPTKASLNPKNTEIECIYGNGVVVGMNYDAAENRTSASIKDYPVTKTVNIDFETISDISLFNADDALVSLRPLTCPDTIFLWIAWEQAGNSRLHRAVYSFTDSSGGTPISTQLTKMEYGRWFWQKDTATAGTYNVQLKETALHDTLKKKGENWVKIPLVAERLYITGHISDDSYFLSLKSVSEDSQAVSSPRYATVYKISNDEYALQLGKTITKFFPKWHLSTIVEWMDTYNIYDDSSNAKIYACINESVSYQDATRGESSYRFSRTRHYVSDIYLVTTDDNGVKTIIDDKKKEQDEVLCGYQSALFEVTSKICKTDSIGSQENSFCDRYSETAKVLIDIIQIMQIVVPALVIIFTSIEFARIVLAGNLDEELPKKKKSIVIRLVIMITFFFLPVITRLIISLAEGVSILEVDCLFNDKKEEDSNAESTAQNCVEINSDETE